MEELFLTEDQIEKLPVDARKDYRKYYLMLHEKKNKSEINSDFLSLLNLSGQISLRVHIIKKLLTSSIDLHEAILIV